jgi:hypothetical protein
VDALTPVVVTRRPNVDEALRALMPLVTKRPTTITYQLVIVVLALALVAYGVQAVTGEHDYVFGPVWIAGGAAVLVLPLLSVRSAVKRLVVTSAKRLVDTHEVLTISASGLDAKSDHATAHFDWAALSMARRLPTGLIYQIGGTTYYVSASEFASVAEFDRAVAIARAGVGANFRD